MSRCQHCNKLTHSEHLDVYFDAIDFDKIAEFHELQNWTPKFMYSSNDERMNNPCEYGKLKIGDIIVHFIQMEKIKEKE